MLNKHYFSNDHSRRNVGTFAIALALVPMLLSGCGGGPSVEAASPNAGNPTVEASNPATPGNVTEQEVANQTNQLIGQIVTVRGEPVKKIDPYSFTMRDGQVGSNQPILVVNATGSTFVLPTNIATNNVQVQVTGQVTKLVVADINRVYGLDLQPNLYVDYEGKPAIIAQSLALAPAPAAVTQDPSPFYGKTIAVPGQVANIVSPNAFTLGENQATGNNLLVLNLIPQTDQKAVTQGENVVVTGVLRKFVIADIEKQYNFALEPDLRRVLVQYTNKPVLIANNVYRAYPSTTPPTP